MPYWYIWPFTYLLSGKARAASSEIDSEDLETGTDMDIIIQKLDELFLPDKGRWQFVAFNKLYNLLKTETEINSTRQRLI